MAWHFDESANGLANQFVTLGDNAALTFPDGDWSIVGWLKLDDNAGSDFQYFLSWGSFDANPSINVFIIEGAAGVDPNKLKVVADDADGDGWPDDGSALVSNGTPGTSTLWQHIAFVNNSDTLYLYINGSEDVNVGASGTFNDINVAGSFYLGCRSDRQAARAFGGSMAEWGKWDRALSVDEIVGQFKGHIPEFYPKDLKWYLPMLRPYVEKRVPLTVTNSSSTVVAHPRIIQPSGIWTPSGVATGNGKVTTIIMSKLIIPALYLKQGKHTRRDFLKNTFLASMGIK